MDKRKDVLKGLLNDKTDDIRRLASEAIEKIETRDRLDVIEKKIAAAELLDKLRAIYALAELKGPRIIELLAKAAKDPSEDVRAAAIRVLGSMGDPAVLAHLVEALKDPNPIVLRVVVDAIGNYKDPRIMGPLMHMLKNPDPGVVERALDVISRFGDKRAEEAMVYFAVKGNIKMRTIAVRALGEMDM